MYVTQRDLEACAAHDGAELQCSVGLLYGPDGHLLPALGDWGRARWLCQGARPGRPGHARAVARSLLPPPCTPHPTHTVDNHRSQHGESASHNYDVPKWRRGIKGTSVKST